MFIVSFFKHQFGLDNTLSRKEKQTERKPVIKCYLSMHTAGNNPFPIQKIIDGEWDTYMEEALCKARSIHCLCDSQAQAENELYRMTRPGNSKAAYILRFGVNAATVKEYAAQRKFSEAIVDAVNYCDLMMKKNVNDDHPVEIIINSTFNSTLSVESQETSAPVLTIINGQTYG